MITPNYLQKNETKYSKGYSSKAKGKDLVFSTIYQETNFMKDILGIIYTMVGGKLLILKDNSQRARNMDGAYTSKKFNHILKVAQIDK